MGTSARATTSHEKRKICGPWRGWISARPRLERISTGCLARRISAKGAPAWQWPARVSRLMSAAADEFSPLTIRDYVAQALTTDQRSDGGSLAFPLLGLFGETGSLLSEVKKKQRDRASYVGYAGAVVEELGDVLWYLTTVAARGGLSLEAIIVDIGGGESAVGSAQLPLTFASLQPAIYATSGRADSAFEHTLLRLAGEVGTPRDRSRREPSSRQHCAGRPIGRDHADPRSSCKRRRGHSRGRCCKNF